MESTKVYQNDSIEFNPYDIILRFEPNGKYTVIRYIST